MSSYVDNVFLTPSQVYGPAENLRYFLERVVANPSRSNAPRFGFAGDGTITGADPIVGTACMTAMRCGGHEIIDAQKHLGNAYRTSTLHGSNMAMGAL